MSKEMDIVDALREDPLLACDPVCLKAADEIERLRTALGKIAAETSIPATYCANLARAALQQKR